MNTYGTGSVGGRHSAPPHSVFSNDVLALRPARAPDLAAENRALLRLAQTMARAPERLLQELVEELCELCDAGSAGLSLLETGQEGQEPCFRWVATAGRFNQYTGQTIPRSLSPCGAVLDTDRMLVLLHPERHYPYIGELADPVEEVLLFPFHQGEVAVGTIWVAAHADDRRFDREDARLIADIAQFAGAAVHASAKAAAHARLEGEARAAAEREVVELGEINRRMHEEDRGKAEFLATLSHELRNAIGPLESGLAVLNRSEDPDTKRRSREIMARQTAQLRRLVDDLLESSRVSAGQLRLQTTLVDLNRIVSQAVEAATERIAQSGQTIQLSLTDRPLLVEGDNQRLNQVFTNLLNNAAKYGRNGRPLSITVARREAQAVVCIKDDGIGIDETMLPRIFELFVQTDHSLNRCQGGLGIGLALVQRLVELHGGRVEARSAGPGLGSEFVVYLPVAGD
ncbi:MAG: GAF domain-containing sensor histidine kinase [Proteobacteria bacterium]|nr:GAF domain-containing sensor histidine kinase [Pseudomonadota bacterium]